MRNSTVKRITKTEALTVQGFDAIVRYRGQEFGAVFYFNDTDEFWCHDGKNLGEGNIPRMIPRKNCYARIGTFR